MNPEESLTLAYSSALQEQVTLSNKIQQAIAKGDFASFKSDVDTASVRLDRELSKINDLSVPAELNNYKSSAQEAITAFKNMTEIGNQFTQLTVNSTEQEYNDLITSFNELTSSKIPEAIEKVNGQKEKLIK
ncbi:MULTISPECIES: hypothetical protein [unclassified Dysgonomonas]|uniref:hypothetical protein n=1 Tax=unclassified Dysgonomonas TaxID=2630389 RepID=UPI002473DE3D|nr:MULTISPECIES: hypothetical protein [unclassified Dysgonomonas]